tara:strand:- start:636 stop:1049 length:414 start_codon:yes stop_codon:yes gene_type:complete
MILVYRPELSNPPMATESSLGFSLLPQGSGRKVEFVQIISGVTRDFSEVHWDRIKGRTVVKRLMSLGALVIQEEEAAPVISAVDQEHIRDVSLTQALGLIEASFDVEQLGVWEAKDQRIKVKNAIAKRITSITEGNG